VYQPQWPLIAETPRVLLDLQVADERWLDHALPHLLAAEETLDLRGDSLVHNDVRSDNVCFLGDRVVLVDWSDARRGAPGFDLANLLQTLPLEGGPDPFTLLPDAAGFAAWRAGELVRRAAGAYGPAPSWLVKVFKRMAVIDLDWAARCLDLPPRHGVRWTEI
jgi:aminoglycoside phosphotransferase (APT) family kinase protein